MQTSGSTSERNCKPSWISNERTKKHTFAKDFSLFPCIVIFSKAISRFPPHHFRLSNKAQTP
jgi:hypothetical protein